MINFEKKYVYCFWDDKLEGKKAFVANSIGVLKDNVEQNDDDWFGEISENTDIGHTSCPFEMKDINGIKNCYQFCYYDPFYELKISYQKGKTIQYFSKPKGIWLDCKEPLWNPSYEYRVKPNEEFHVIYDKSVEGFSVDNAETNVDNIFFESTERNCFEWIKSHKDLEDIIKAYYNDETIQYFEHGMWINWNLNKFPTSLVNTKWRIKPNNEYEIVIIYGIGLRMIKSTPNGNIKILFEGTKEECERWVKNNYHIAIVINGYFENKPIMYKEKGVKNDPWRPTKDVPYDWDFDHYKYRIATHEEFLKKVHSPKEYVPFENTQEFIEAWEKKYPTNKDRPNGTMPLIWIKEKEDEDVHLINDFYKTGVGTSSIILSFESLFKEYTFVDGSVCGKLKVE